MQIGAFLANEGARWWWLRMEMNKFAFTHTYKQTQTHTHTHMHTFNNPSVQPTEKDIQLSNDDSSCTRPPGTGTMFLMVPFWWDEIFFIVILSTHTILSLGMSKTFHFSLSSKAWFMAVNMGDFKNIHIFLYFIIFYIFFNLYCLSRIIHSFSFSY